MTQHRRRTRGLPQARPPKGWMPVEVVATERHTPTVTIPAVTPALTEVLTDGQEQAQRGETADLGSFAQYSREPVPDIWSADPADRTEWFRVRGGSEPLFEAVVADLGAEWLLDTSLAPPPRTAASDPGPEAPPPVGEEAGPAAAQASPQASGPVHDTDPGASPAGEDRDQTSLVSPGSVPAEDEPVAEKECAE